MLYTIPGYIPFCIPHTLPGRVCGLGVWNIQGPPYCNTSARLLGVTLTPPPHPPRQIFCMACNIQYWLWQYRVQDQVQGEESTPRLDAILGKEPEAFHGLCGHRAILAIDVCTCQTNYILHEIRLF